MYVLVCMESLLLVFYHSIHTKSLKNWISLNNIKQFFHKLPRFLYFSDEDEEDDDALLHIPVAPEIEDPEEAPIIPGGVAATQEV